MNRQEILNWLREDNPRRLEELWRCADAVRRAHVGDAVHLRGLVEFSNHCVRPCGYCGLRANNTGISRYRMTAAEIVACAQEAVRFGYGTLVLQSGEDPGITAQWMAEVIRQIKAETALAVTLSLGERSCEEFALWREAGADRYLLRFETSNRVLYERIHPPVRGQHSDRFVMLRELRELGYEVGSGVMIGIPGQTYEDLADDLEWFRRLDLDMIGAGPFIPHPATPMGQIPESTSPAPGQVPNSEPMTYKLVALARIVCPDANIPSTTALATLNRAEGRELGLMRGANVVMPNLTPPAYRRRYEIYPAKACLFEDVDSWHQSLTTRIRAIGRVVGGGPGESPNRRRRRMTTSGVAPASSRCKHRRDACATPNGSKG